jgi:hypothetical protein
MIILQSVFSSCNNFSTSVKLPTIRRKMLRHDLLFFPLFTAHQHTDLHPLFHLNRFCLSHPGKCTLKGYSLQSQHLLHEDISTRASVERTRRSVSSVDNVVHERVHDSKVVQVKICGEVVCSCSCCICFVTVLVTVILCLQCRVHFLQQGTIAIEIAKFVIHFDTVSHWDVTAGTSS